MNSKSEVKHCMNKGQYKEPLSGTLDQVIIRLSPTDGNFFCCCKILGFAMSDISGSFVLLQKTLLNWFQPSNRTLNRSPPQRGKLIFKNLQSVFNVIKFTSNISCSKVTVDRSKHMWFKRKHNDKSISMSLCTCICFRRSSNWKEFKITPPSNLKCDVE